jgi:hypothetical protein
VSWGVFAGSLGLALFIIAYLYFRVRQTEALAAAVKAEEAAREKANKEFAKSQDAEKAADAEEAVEVVESGDRGRAVDFLRDSLRKN